MQPQCSQLTLQGQTSEWPTGNRVLHRYGMSQAGQHHTCTHQHHTHTGYGCTLYPHANGLTKKNHGVFIARLQECYVECTLFLFLDLTAASKSLIHNICCQHQEPRHRYAHMDDGARWFLVKCRRCCPCKKIIRLLWKLLKLISIQATSGKNNIHLEYLNSPIPNVRGWGRPCSCQTTTLMGL